MTAFLSNLCPEMESHCFRQDYDNNRGLHAGAVVFIGPISRQQGGLQRWRGCATGRALSSAFRKIIYEHPPPPRCRKTGPGKLAASRHQFAGHSGRYQRNIYSWFKREPAGNGFVTASLRVLSDSKDGSYHS